MNIYKSLNIGVGKVMKNPEMLKFVPNHLKTKKMCKQAIKKRTQQMCDKAILGNGGTLISVPDHYKNQEMRSKAVDNYLHALEFVPECYKTQKMCDKAINTYLSTIKFVPECFMTQEK